MAGGRFFCQHRNGGVAFTAALPVEEEVQEVLENGLPRGFVVNRVGGNDDSAVFLRHPRLNQLEYGSCRVAHLLFLRLALSAVEIEEGNGFAEPFRWVKFSMALLTFSLPKVAIIMSSGAVMASQPLV